jgi:hypothetical protein
MVCLGLHGPCSHIRKGGGMEWQMVERPARCVRWYRRTGCRSGGPERKNLRHSRIGGDIKKVTHRDGMYILDVIYNTGQSDGAAEPGKVYIKIANGGQAAQISFDSPTKWQPYTRCK